LNNSATCKFGYILDVFILGFTKYKVKKYKQKQNKKKKKKIQKNKRKSKRKKTIPRWLSCDLFDLIEVPLVV